MLSLTVTVLLVTMLLTPPTAAATPACTHITTTSGQYGTMATSLYGTVTSFATYEMAIDFPVANSSTAALFPPSPPPSVPRPRTARAASRFAAMVDLADLPAWTPKNCASLAPGIVRTPFIRPEDGSGSMVHTDLAHDVDNDGLYDALVSSSDGVYYMPNANYTREYWTLNDDPIPGIGGTDVWGSAHTPATGGVRTLADMDLDGNIDIMLWFFENSAVAQWYAGFGNGSFAATPTLIYDPASTTYPYHPTLVDYTGDGVRDLVVGLSDSTVVLIAANPIGLISAALSTPLVLAALPTVSQPRYIQMGDFDADGDLDLAILYYNGNDGIQLIRNDVGGLPGMFVQGAAPWALFYCPTARGLAVANMNADAKDEMVIACHSTRDLIYITHDTGSTFTTYVFEGSFQPYDMIVTDIDNNTFVDVIVTYSTTLRIYQRNSDTSFSLWYNSGFDILGSSISTYAVELCDLNGDAYSDLCFSGTGYSFIYINDGTGVHSSANIFPHSLRYFTDTDSSAGATTFIYSNVYDDVDNDGILDALTFRASPPPTPTLHTMHFITRVAHPPPGTGLWNYDVAAPVRIDTPDVTAQHMVYALDVDVDGALDVVFSGRNASEIPAVYWARNLGSRTFAFPEVLVRGYSTSSSAAQLLAVDLDGDAHPELVVVWAVNDYIDILYAPTPGAPYARNASYSVADAPYSLKAYDINADGSLDLIFRTQSRYIRALVADPTAYALPFRRFDTMTYQLVIDCTSELYDFIVGHFNPTVDSFVDVWCVKYNNVLEFAFGTSTSGFDFTPRRSLTSVPQMSNTQFYGSVANAFFRDINDDGFPDAIIDTYTSRTVFYNFGSDGNTYYSYGLYNAPSDATDSKALDVDGDSFPEVVTGTYASGGYIYATRANNQFWTSFSTYTSIHNRVLRLFAPTDVNLDGRPDLFHSTTANSIGYSIHSGDTADIYPSAGRMEVPAPFCTTPIYPRLYDLFADGLADGLMTCGNGETMALLSWSFNPTPTLDPLVEVVDLRNGLGPLPYGLYWRNFGVGDLIPGGAHEVVVTTTTVGSVHLFTFGTLSGAPLTPTNASDARLHHLALVVAYHSGSSFDLGALFADVDGDGLLDIVHAQTSEPYLAYILNAGTPAAPDFNVTGAATVVPVRTNINVASTSQYAIRSFTVDDVDNDGAIDIVISTTSGSGVYTLYNFSPYVAAAAFNESGAPAFSSRFRARKNTAGGVTGTNHDSVEVADMNGDGWRDLESVYQTSDLAYITLENTYAKSPSANTPETFRVDVARCGWTLTCVVDAISRLASVCSEDVIVVPEGTYTGCFHAAPQRVTKSIHLVGENNATVFDCAIGPTGVAGAGAYGFRVDDPTVALTVTGITFRGFRTDSAGFGGAALQVADGAALYVRACAFDACSAAAFDQTSVRSPLLGFGAAVLVTDGSTFDAHASSFTSNAAGHSGGAVAILGAANAVSITRCSFASNVAVYSGGALFFEQTDGANAVELLDSSFTANTAVGDPKRADVIARGGAAAFTVYGGVLELEFGGCAWSGNRAKADAGAIHVLATLTAAVATNVSRTTFSGNSCGGSGGAIVYDVVDQALMTVDLLAAVAFSSNTAGASGGAMALHASSDAASQVLAPRLFVTSSAPDLLFAANRAAIHGGAVFLTTEGGQTAPLAPAELVFAGATFSANSAGRMGGCVAGVGRPDIALTGGLLSANIATFGATVATARAAGYLTGAESATGFTVEASASSVPPAAFDGVAATGGCGAIVRGSAVIDGGTVLAANVASYGAVAFACENTVALANLAGLTVPAQPVAGGVVFQCATSLDCGAAGNPCCVTPAPSIFAGTPWLAVDAASEGVINGTMGALLAAATYGPLRATPVTTLEYVTPFPASVSTGLPFGDAGVVAVTDAFGQTVIDANTVAELALEGDGYGLYQFSGGAQQVLVTSSPISFGSSQLSVTVGTPVGGVAGLIVRMAKSAVDPASPLYASLTGSTAVSACLPGSGVVIRDGSPVLECAQCVEGTFSNETSLAPCISCPSADFLTGIGATECQLCPDGTGLVGGQFDPLKGINCTCLPGYWHREAAYNEPCELCPRGGACAGGVATPVAQPGWFPTTVVDVFLECPNAGACLGGFPYRCAEGYEARLCAACKPGYYSLSGRCYKCDDRTIPILTLVCLLSFAFVFLLVWLNSKEELTYRFAAVMIGFNSLQISAMYGRLELPWSGFARTFFDIVSFLNLNFDLSSPECATFTNDVWLLKWWITMLLPLLFCIPFGGVFVGWTVYIKWGAAKLDRVAALSVGSLADACRRAYLQLLALLYLPLAAMTLSYFACSKNSEGRWVLDGAPSKSCGAKWWWNFFGPAVFFSLVYAVGIPSGVYLLLTRAHDGDEDAYALFALRYAFLVGRFKPAYFRFEVWIMVRKVAVVLVMTIFRSAIVKAHMGVLALVGSLLQLSRFLPYLSDFHNSLALACLCSCTAILWAGTFGPSFARDTGVLVAIIVNIAAIVVGNIIDLVIIYRAEKAAEKDFDAADGAFVGVADSQFATFGADGLDSGVQLSVLDSGSRGPAHASSTDSIQFGVAGPGQHAPEPHSVQEEVYASEFSSAVDVFGAGAADSGSVIFASENPVFLADGSGGSSLASIPGPPAKPAPPPQSAKPPLPPPQSAKPASSLPPPPPPIAARPPLPPRAPPSSSSCGSSSTDSSS